MAPMNVTSKYELVNFLKIPSEWKIRAEPAVEISFVSKIVELNHLGQYN